MAMQPYAINWHDKQGNVIGHSSVLSYSLAEAMLSLAEIHPQLPSDVFIAAHYVTINNSGWGRISRASCTRIDLTPDLLKQKV